MAVIPLTDIGDIKLYILCIMDYVGYPLDYNEINDLALYDQIVTNIDFIDAFDSLASTDLIDKNSDGQYFITENGSFIALTLKNDLSGYIHDRGLKSALQFISFQKSGIKYSTEVTERDDGRCDTVFILKKDNTELMKISLLLDTKYQSQKMAVAFSEKPEAFYARILAMLSGE